ncbi:hypothetical protein EAG_00383, partial [Camponotus floridanus]
VRFIQINLNRSWGALDLLRQYMVEADIGLAIVAEPPSRLEESNTYFKSLNDLAAILWRPEGLNNLSCRVLERGHGFVIAQMGNVCVTSCYVSPNVNNDIFCRTLDNLSNSISRLATQPFLVCGDFNAHSTLWGSATSNRRGELVARWSAMLDLRLLNTG